MFTSKRLYAVAAAILIVALLTTPASAERKDKMPLKTVLSNGLTVILSEDHSSPVVAYQMWVRVGSADEWVDEEGLSHVFEHMLFKGTQKRQVGEIAREIDEASGYINAYTSYDQTVYHLIVASRYHMKGLDILSDVVQNSAFDKKELAKELEVVQEEILMGEDKPGRKIFKELMKSTFKTHPYGKPVIGTPESVASFTRSDIVRFFKKWYIPNNMTLVVTGDFHTQTLLEEINKSFKDFKKKRDPHRKRPREQSKKRPSVNITSASVAEARLAMAFHIPELKHPDTHALDVTALILGQGASSRLNRKLKVNDQLVHSITASAMTPKDPGAFYISSTLKASNIVDATRNITSEITKLKTLGPTPDELRRAKLSLKSGFIYERETMEGRASQLGYYETMAGDLTFEEKYIEAVEEVTTDDVKRIMGKYLDGEKVSIVVLMPEEWVQSISPEWIEGAAKEGFKVVEEPSLKQKSGEVITKHKLKNGATIIIRERHSNPTVAIYANFPGGLRYETRETNGLSNIVATLLTRGTKKRTRKELAREVEGLAASIGGFSGKNSIGVSGKFLSGDFERGFEIVGDIIMNPTFEGSELDKVRSETLAAIKREGDNLPRYTFKLLLGELFKTHPYGMPTYGTKETVTGFKRKDVVEFSRKVIVPADMVLSIVGDIDTGFAIRKAEELFQDFKNEVKRAPGPARERPQKKIRKTGEEKNKAQTNIAIGFPGTTVSGMDRYPLSILTETLSGQGGRLFIKLRDELSLAYSVSAFSRAGVEPGFIGVYIGTSPEKKDDALANILIELQKVIDDGISAGELERAKSALIGEYEIGLQDVSSQAADIAVNELLGLGYNHFREYPDIIGSITQKDVKKAARKYLKLNAYSISIVGPNGFNGK